MSLFRRFVNAIKGWSNKIVEKLEDPNVMIDQYIRNLEGELGTVRGRTADVMVAAKKCHKRVDDHSKALAEIEKAIEAAAAQGNNDDVLELTMRRDDIAQELECFKQDMAATDENVVQIKAMHDELTWKLQECKRKRSVLKSRISVAKTYEYMAKTQDILSSDNTGANIARLEERVDDAIMRADAMMTLSKPNDHVAQLIQKYKTPALTVNA